MIKFTLFALLCLSLSEEIFGKFQEDKVGSDGYRLELNLDDSRCCKDVKNKEDSEENQIFCLDSKNSKQISDAAIVVLKQAELAGNVYEAVKALRIADFMVSKITYQEWAENIQYGKYNFEGFSKLQKLVSKFVLCKKVCKVFFFLRDELREHAAQADFEEYTDEYDQQLYMEYSGEFIILGDIRRDIEINFARTDVTYAGVRFSAGTMIIDSNLLDSNGWAGKNIIIDVDNVIVPKKFVWSVEGNEG